MVRRVKTTVPKKSGSNNRASSKTNGVIDNGATRPVDIAFSFDTTGSMNSCIAEVRKNLQELVERLLTDVPGLRIAVFAHGDYCDKATYVTKWIDFTNNAKDLCDFIRKVEGTGGGDREECYELVLHQARTELSWTAGSIRSLVMIGDAPPHKAGTKHYGYTAKDWKVEVNELAKQDTRVYGIQCNGYSADDFWKELVKYGGGKLVKLEEFRTIRDMMMTICFKEYGGGLFEAYEREVHDREGPGIRPELTSMFNALRDDTATTSAEPDGKSDASSSDSGIGHDERDGKKEKVAKGRVMKKKEVMVAKKAVKRAVKVLTTRSNRESVSEKQFKVNFGDADWSGWHLVLSKKDPETGWSFPRSDGRPGYQNDKFFKNRKENRGIYEFAVQPRTHCKRYTVFASSSAHCFYPRSWEKRLLRGQRISEQVDKVVRKGCKLFVRKARNYPRGDGPWSGKSEELVFRRKLTKTYDYAWNLAETGRVCHRPVTLKGVEISSMQV